MTTYGRVSARLKGLFASDLFAPATITRKTGEAYDPRQRKTVATGTTSIPCRAKLDEVTNRAGNGEITTSTEIMMNAEPRSGDTITLRSVVYRVGAVAVEAPDGKPLYWIATVTR